MNQIDYAIFNLEHIRDILLKISESDKNYNTIWGNTLYSLGWTLHRHAQDLKETQYLYGSAQAVEGFELAKEFQNA